MFSACAQVQCSVTREIKACENIMNENFYNYKLCSLKIKFKLKY